MVGVGVPVTFADTSSLYSAAPMSGAYSVSVIHRTRTVSRPAWTTACLMIRLVRCGGSLSANSAASGALAEVADIHVALEPLDVVGPRHPEPRRLQAEPDQADASEELKHLRLRAWGAGQTRKDGHSRNSSDSAPSARAMTWEYVLTGLSSVVIVRKIRGHERNRRPARVNDTPDRLAGRREASR